MEFKEFKIKIPKSSNDLRIKHYGIFKLDMQTISDIGLTGKLKLINEFTGTPVSKLKMLTHEQVRRIYAMCLSTFIGLRISDNPPKEIMLDGILYELINLEKVGVGWHIDISMASKQNWLEKDPVKLACLFYHPKGELYGSVDENENIKTSISDKEKVFKEKMPLRTFIECLGFFLQKYERSMRRYTEKKKAEQKTMEILIRMNGKKLLRPLLKNITRETGMPLQ